MLASQVFLATICQGEKFLWVRAGMGVALTKSHWSVILLFGADFCSMDTPSPFILRYPTQRSLSLCHSVLIEPLPPRRLIHSLVASPPRLPLLPAPRPPPPSLAPCSTGPCSSFMSGLLVGPFTSCGVPHAFQPDTRLCYPNDSTGCQFQKNNFLHELWLNLAQGGLWEGRKGISGGLLLYLENICHQVHSRYSVPFQCDIGQHLYYISVGIFEYLEISHFKSNAERNKETRLSQWEQRSELEIRS